MSVFSVKCLHDSGKFLSTETLQYIKMPDKSTLSLGVFFDTESSQQVGIEVKGVGRGARTR